MKDKTSRVFELIASIVLGLYCVVMIIYALLHPISTNVDGMHSYTFPVTLYAIMLVCCILLIVQNRITAAKQKNTYEAMTAEQREHLSEEERSGFQYHSTDRRVWITVGLIIVYAALWKVVGFMMSTLLFITTESRVLKKDAPIWKCALVALGADILIYLIFVRLFSISLPETFLRAII